MINESKEPDIRLATALRTIEVLNQQVTDEDETPLQPQEICDQLVGSGIYKGVRLFICDNQYNYRMHVSAGYPWQFDLVMKRWRQQNFTHCEQSLLQAPDILQIEDPEMECQNCPYRDSFCSSVMLGAGLCHLQKPLGFITASIPDRRLPMNLEKNLFAVLAGDITRTVVKAETSLIATLHYHKSLINQIREEILVIDTAYRIMDLNEAALSRCGLSREDALGRHCFEIQYGYNEPCSREGHKCNLRKTFATGRTLTCIHEKMEPDGSKRWVDLLHSPIRDQNGKVTSVIQTARDITELMQVQKDLQVSRGRYATAQQIARMGDFVWNFDTGEIACSAGLVDLLRYDRSDKIDYETITAKIIHPNDRQRLEEWLRNAINSGERSLSPIEYRIYRRDDQLCHVRTLGTLEFENNRAVRFFAIVQDITSKRLVELALAEKEKYFQILFENSPIPLWEINLNELEAYLHELSGDSATDLMTLFETHPEYVPECIRRVKLIEINRPVLDLLEAESKTDLIQNISRIFTPSASREFSAVLDAVQKKFGRYEFDIGLKTLKGNDVYIHAKWTEIRSRGKSEGNMMFTTINITERKKAEMELEQHRDHLEELIQTRTAELERKYSELERLNRLFTGREYRIKELREKVAMLEKKLKK